MPQGRGPWVPPTPYGVVCLEPWGRALNPLSTPYGMVPPPSLMTHKWAGLPGGARIFTNNTELKKHKAINHVTSGRAELARAPGIYAQHAKSTKSTATINMLGVRSSPNPRTQ